jgi:hypothetical protein
MTKNQIIIAGALFILIVLIAAPLWKSGREPVIPQANPEVRETVPQAGIFELPPSGGNNTEGPVMTTTVTTAVNADQPRKKAPNKARHIEEEPQDKGYDSIDPGLVPNPPKSPSPEIIRNMQKKGIVLY